MKKIILCLIVMVGLFTITGCGKNDKDKMLEFLEKENFHCTYKENETICTKEDNNKKHSFEISDSRIDYEETVYDSGTTRLVTNIKDTNYNDSNNHFLGIIKAYFKGEEEMSFYPENCKDEINCHLSVGEKVYPVLKEEYDNYKKYFESDSYREYLRLYKKANKSLSEEFRLFDLETTFEINSDIKDDDMFTDNVNDALRYYEKTLESAGIILGKR